MVSPDGRLNRRAETCCVHNSVEYSCLCQTEHFLSSLITCQYFIYFQNEDQIVESLLQVTSLKFQLWPHFTLNIQPLTLFRWCCEKGGSLGGGGRGDAPGSKGRQNNYLKWKDYFLRLTNFKLLCQMNENSVFVSFWVHNLCQWRPSWLVVPSIERNLAFVIAMVKPRIPSPSTKAAWDFLFYSVFVGRSHQLLRIRSVQRRMMFSE